MRKAKFNSTQRKKISKIDLKPVPAVVYRRLVVEVVQETLSVGRQIRKYKTKTKKSITVANLNNLLNLLLSEENVPPVHVAIGPPAVARAYCERLVANLHSALH